MLQILQCICNHYRRTKNESIKTFISTLTENMSTIYYENNSNRNIFFRYALKNKTEALEASRHDLVCNISHSLMALPVYIIYNGNNIRTDQSNYDLFSLLSWFLNNLNDTREFNHPYTQQQINNLSQIVIDRNQHATIKHQTEMNTYKVFLEVTKNILTTQNFLKFCTEESSQYIPSMPNRTHAINYLRDMPRRLAINIRSQAANIARNQQAYNAPIIFTNIPYFRQINNRLATILPVTTHNGDYSYQNDIGTANFKIQALLTAIASLIISTISSQTGLLLAAPIGMKYAYELGKENAYESAGRGQRPHTFISKIYRDMEYDRKWDHLSFFNNFNNRFSGLLQITTVDGDHSYSNHEKVGKFKLQANITVILLFLSMLAQFAKYQANNSLISEEQQLQTNTIVSATISLLASLLPLASLSLLSLCLSDAYELGKDDAYEYICRGQRPHTLISIARQRQF